MLSLSSLPWLSDELRAVRLRMGEALSLPGAGPKPQSGKPPSSGGGFLEQALAELLSREGKMLRPALLLVAARLGQTDPERVRSLAAAVELLHLASLVHDDVIDAAALRRGLPSLQSLHGARTAVLMGDFILTRAMRLIVSSAEGQNPLPAVDALARICEGEIEQGRQKFRVDMSLRRYLRRIHGKTASLFAGALHLGALVADLPALHQSALRRYGYCLGMGFQIIDDVLDYTADDASLGKPSGSDAAEGVFTLPLMHALAGPRQKQLFKLLAKHPYSRWRITSLLRIVRESDGPRRALDLAALYTRRALRELEKLPEGEARAGLSELALALLSRQA